MSSEEAAKAEEAKTQAEVPKTQEASTTEPAVSVSNERKMPTAQEFKAAQAGINKLVKINYPDSNESKGFMTICQGFVCMWSLYTDMPACCSVNDECTCLCCQGGAGYQCFTCVSDEATKKSTKSCETCIGVARCCDMTDPAKDGEGEGFICCEESLVVIAYCCTRGAAKGKCHLGILPEVISSVRQECCCDCRCQIPPGDPDKGTAGCVHPLGVSCCGKLLYGKGWGSAHASE